MSLDKLKSYRINNAYTEGVIINLDDADDVDFLVKLPGPYNRPYIAAIYGDIDIDMSGETSNKINVLRTREVQEKAFLDHCLVSIDGEVPPKDFAELYPAALEELMSKATAKVEEISARVDAGIKKSQPTSIGKVAGATS